MKVFESSLTPPNGPLTVLPRRRIDRKIDQGTQRALTLISAPAGFGKTAALINWYDSARLNRNVSWLGLAGGDDDPLKLWGGVVASMRRTLPGVLDQTHEYLSEGGLPSGETFARMFVNELCLVTESCVVVIDDFHEITDPSILRTLADVIEHLPPQIRFVLSTRTYPDLPLLRWAGRGLVAEIRVETLRFNVEEARSYLDLTIAGELSDVDTATLIDRCDGWIACLYLAGLRVLESEDPSQFIADLSEAPSPLAHYLVSEVMGSLPSHVREFLEDTSVLTELSVEICDVLTGRSDAKRVLADLDRSGVFASRDTRPGVYRNHPLLRSLLYSRLTRDPERAAALHRSAATWFYSVGDLLEALDQAIAGADWERVTSWMCEHQDELLQMGPRVVSRLLERIQDADADSTELKELGLKAALITGSAADLNSIAKTDHSENGLSLASIAGIASAALEGENAEVLEELRKHSDSEMAPRLFALLMARSLTAMDRFEEGATQLRKIVRGRVDDPFFELSATCLLAWNRVTAGRLGAGKAMAERAVQLSVDRGIRWFHAVRYAEFALAQVEYDRGNLEDAYRMASAVHDASSEDAYISVNGAILLSRIQWALGDRGGARDSLSGALAGPLGRPISGDLALKIALTQADLYLREMDASLAESWLPDWRSRVEKSGDSYEERLVLARFLIADNRGGDARRLLEQESEGSDRPVRYLLESWKLSAIAGLTAGDPAAGLMLEIALSMGEPERFVQTFVDDARSLAAMTNGPDTGVFPPVASIHSAWVETRQADEKTPTAQQPDLMVEKLTERELAVLRYLPSRMSNKEIAERLFVSVNTVKSHIKSIYRKLGVSSRNEAVGQAAALRVM